jgi:2-polyprenyl-6-methoxyphenol hydroxylase-like FAD-dependent oxidoreductase
VIGAGPSGALMALLLARKGFTVDLYEKRRDWRIHEEVEVEHKK